MIRNERGGRKREASLLRETDGTLVVLMGR